MEWLLLSLFIDNDGSGFEAPRASSGAIFSSQKECEAEILKKLQSEDHVTVGENASAGNYSVIALLKIAFLLS